MAIRKSLKRGFTLIELMIVVAIIGILAVLAVYGVSRYLKSSKTAEATNNVGQMGKNASEAFTREKMSGSYVAPGGTSGISTCLCGSAALTPGSVPKSAKFVSSLSDWATGDQSNGWTCLKFSVDQPQYYAYNYTSDSAGCTAQGTTMTAAAYGDLDGNNTTSSFLLEGHVVAGGLVMAPKVNEISPEE